MKKFSFLFVILVLAFFGGIAWWQTNSAPVDKYDTKKRVFSIQQGMGVREVANDLKEKNFIKDPVVFFLIVKKLGLDGKIQAGEFYLSPSQSAEEIARSLQNGSFDIQVTIPEGKRAEEVATILQEHLSSYDASWPNKLAEHEGYLFPDTYSFAKDADIETIIKTMTDNFEEKYASIPPGNHSSTSKNDLVIIASLVEREALFPEDRPLIASVIFNRLEIGMGLNIDATVQYALGYQPQQKTWWKKKLNLQDLKVASLYNTHIHAGLPPTPIANPGLDVLKAVINAPDTNYMYYVADAKGHNHYAITNEEHNENVHRYQVR